MVHSIAKAIKGDNYMTVAIAILILDALLAVGLITYIVVTERKRKAKPDDGCVCQPDCDTVLRLEKVVKDYGSGENTVHALKGVSLGFRKKFPVHFENKRVLF